MLLLAGAFALVQARLIDQALFNQESFAGSPFWQRLSTVIPGMDVDATQLLVCVVGHVIWSFGAPIAVMEACAPRSPADRPWFGRIGLTVVAVLYLVAAVYFHYELVLGVLLLRRA